MTQPVYSVTRLHASSKYPIQSIDTGAVYVRPSVGVKYRMDFDKIQNDMWLILNLTTLSRNAPK